MPTITVQPEARVRAARTRPAGRAALVAACATLMLNASPLALAGPGHDHSDEPAAAGEGPGLPRFVATSELFELVGVVNGTKLTLYLDHSATNAPVKDAKVELEMGGTKVAVSPHAEGEFEATLAAALKPGVIPITATVSTAKDSDLLAGELDLHAEGPAKAAAAPMPWKTYVTWGAGGLAVLAVVWMAIRRFTGKRALNASFGSAA